MRQQQQHQKRHRHRSFFITTTSSTNMTTVSLLFSLFCISFFTPCLSSSSNIPPNLIPLNQLFNSSSSSSSILTPHSIHLHHDNRTQILILSSSVPPSKLHLHPKVRQPLRNKTTSTISDATLFIIRARIDIPYAQWIIAIPALKSVLKSTLDRWSNLYIIKREPSLMSTSSSSSSLSIMHLLKISPFGFIRWRRWFNPLYVPSSKLPRPSGISWMNPGILITPAGINNNNVNNKNKVQSSFITIDAYSGKNPTSYSSSSDKTLITLSLDSSKHNDQSMSCFLHSDINQKLKTSCAFGNSSGLIIKKTSLLPLPLYDPTAFHFNQYATISIGRSSFSEMIPVTIVYERAFSFDWHSRRDEDTTKVIHQLVVISYLVNATEKKLIDSSLRSIVITIPVEDTLGGPAFNLIGLKSSYALLLRTTIPLNGNIFKDDNNNGQLTFGVNVNGTNSNSAVTTWFVLLDPTASYGVRIIRAGRNQVDEEMTDIGGFDVNTKVDRAVVYGIGPEKKMDMMMNMNENNNGKGKGYENVIVKTATVDISQPVITEKEVETETSN